VSVIVRRVAMLQVCTNGLVSFGKQIKTSRFDLLPRSGTNIPFIAPNWFDFDTTVTDSSRVYYRLVDLGKRRLTVTF